MNCAITFPINVFTRGPGSKLPEVVSVYVMYCGHIPYDGFSFLTTRKLMGPISDWLPRIDISTLSDK